MHQPVQTGRVEERIVRGQDGVRRRAVLARLGQHEGAVGEHVALGVSDVRPARGRGDRPPRVRDRVVDGALVGPRRGSAEVFAALDDHAPVGQDRRSEVQRVVTRRHRRDLAPGSVDVAALGVRRELVPVGSYLRRWRLVVDQHRPVAGQQHRAGSRTEAHFSAAAQGDRSRLSHERRRHSRLRASQRGQDRAHSCSRGAAPDHCSVCTGSRSAARHQGGQHGDRCHHAGGHTRSTAQLNQRSSN